MLTMRKLAATAPIIATLVFTALLFPAAADAASKKKHDVWRLKVRFIVGVVPYDAAAAQARIRRWVQVAENLYRDTPSLKIQYEIVRKERLGGKRLAVIDFNSSKDYNKWMDKHADNVATSKTDGHLTVVVTNQICLKNSSRQQKKTGKQRKCIGGRAWFPHWVNPFNRKTGIVVRYDNPADTLAHEIGHFLGLKHTFDSYVNVDPKLNCNKEYRPHAKCKSCKGVAKDGNCSGGANVMDYCSTSSSYLNACQKRRAANQRRSYMTTKGDTNYRKLKGLR